MMTLNKMINYMVKWAKPLSPKGARKFMVQDIMFLEKKAISHTQSEYDLNELEYDWV